MSQETDRSEVGEGRAGKDENPIQRAPKPEMLETTGHMHGRQPHNPDPESGFCLACLLHSEIWHLKEALRASEATVKSLAFMLGWENVPPQETLERDINALRSRMETAEASVESLTKERNEAQAALVAERGAHAENLREVVNRGAVVLEAARAEATKAEMPDEEIVAARVHKAWIKSKRAVGVTSRCSESGEELMVPYDHLSEKAKDLDRNTVRAVYAAIRAPRPHHEHCDTLQSGPQGGPSTKPCNCPSSPTPPREEPGPWGPIGTCRASKDGSEHPQMPQCVDWKPVPSPEPPREEPSK